MPGRRNSSRFHRFELQSLRAARSAVNKSRSFDVFLRHDFAQARLVVGESDVEHPMKPVFYAPMAAHGENRLLG
jgi:hypothetical protein